MKVIVAEDSHEVVETIKLCLSMRWPGCTVFGTARGRDLTPLVRREEPDLVLLDLHLEDQHGLGTLRVLREVSWVPVIIVSGQSDEVTRIRGLEEGADDYIVKPFSHTELLARVKAVLRRAGRSHQQAAGNVISADGLVIDTDKRRLYVDGKLTELTGSEWALLSYLLQNQGRVISTHSLAKTVWGSSYVEGSAIRMCIRRLRNKLGNDTRARSMIRSHRGVGYSLELSREASAR